MEKIFINSWRAEGETKLLSTTTLFVCSLVDFPTLSFPVVSLHQVHTPPPPNAGKSVVYRYFSHSSVVRKRRARVLKEDAALISLTSSCRHRGRIGHISTHEDDTPTSISLICSDIQDAYSCNALFFACRFCAYLRNIQHIFKGIFCS